MSRGQIFKFSWAIPPDPLAGAYQVWFAYHASYIRSSTLSLLPFLMLLRIWQCSLKDQP